MVQQIDFTFEKIFYAWKNLESCGKEDVEKELRLFIEICRNCRKVAHSMIEEYTNIYRMESIADMPILTTFFKEVAGYSKKGYAFLTEGYDIANLKEYLRLNGKNEMEIITTLNGISNYAVYLKHAFLKIINEPDKAKKHIMLRGMLGM